MLAKQKANPIKTIRFSYQIFKEAKSMYLDSMYL